MLYGKHRKRPCDASSGPAAVSHRLFLLQHRVREESTAVQGGRSEVTAQHCKATRRWCYTRKICKNTSTKSRHFPLQTVARGVMSDLLEDPKMRWASGAHVDQSSGKPSINRIQASSSTQTKPRPRGYFRLECDPHELFVL